MATIFETKMPAYLVMSRGDLVAETLSIIDRIQTAMSGPEGEAMREAFFEEGPSALPQSLRDDRETLRVVNNALADRFQIHIHPTSDDED